MIKRHKTKKTQQLDFDFKQPFSNKIAQKKQQISKKFHIFETKRYIRSPYTWIFVLIALSLVAVQGYYIFVHLDSLPRVVPIYLNSIALEKRLGEKYELFAIPTISLIIVSITTISGIQLYNTRRELTIFSLVNMLASVSVLTLVLLRIFAIYL